MRLTVRHVTRLDYEADVSERVMDVRLGPLSDEHQRWDRHEMVVSPHGSVRPYRDGGGNSAYLITIARAHRFVEVVSGGEVETLLRNPFVPPDEPPPPLGPLDRHDALAPSPLIPRERALAAMAKPHRPSSPDGTLEAVQTLTALVHRGFEYRPGTTDVSTALRDVLAARAGVCQDLAHVLIGMCRSLGIPARYVSGYIQTGGSMLGGEASHAWVEAWLPTHGWRGFDPTNDVLAADRHVKMAIGRDYRDVPPTRGVFRGQAEEKLSVDVRVRRAR